MKKQKYYFIIITTLSIIAFLWVTLQVLTSSYDQDVIKKKTELMQENRKLNVEYANLTSPAKVEAYAKEHFGLDQPVEKQFRYIRR